MVGCQPTVCMVYNTCMGPDNNDRKNNKYEEKPTGMLFDELKNTKDRKQLDAYMESIRDKYPTDFSQYLRHIMKSRGVDTGWLYRNAYLERTFAYQIVRGARHPSRDKIMLIALALKMDLTETQRALEMSNAGILYPKDERDSLLIYAVEHSMSIRDANALLASYGFNELE